jgi:23S rRNA (adenine2503-C2)-methyltransferase
VLLRGINDSLEHATELARWCSGLPCVVNLIPYNPQRDAPFAVPDESVVMAFLRKLRAEGVFTKRRVTQGQDISAACGQLATPMMSPQSRQLAVL